jgi:hypothetical protein
MIDNYIYGEYVRSNYRNRNCIYKLPDFPDLCDKGNFQCFCSVYRYTNKIFDHINRRGSIKGYKGSCKANGLHFDFDSIDDQSYVDVKKFIDNICNDKYKTHIDDIKIYYSGNKGFHIIIYNDDTQDITTSNDTDKMIKKICTFLAKKYSTFDRSVYDKTRLIRVINSVNEKTGLYKIPLYAAEIYTLKYSDIKKLAKNQRRLTDTETIKRFKNGHI